MTNGRPNLYTIKNNERGMEGTLDYIFNEEGKNVKWEELVRAYMDCRRRKRRTENALQFEVEDSEKLYNLYIELNNDAYEVGRSIVFCVDKPVKREVFAADFRDRIVHHLVINRVNKYLEEEFISDTYSCRKGKGTSKAVERCAEMIREATESYSVPAWVVKGDLQAFFMGIVKDILYKQLETFIRRKGQENGENVEHTLGLIRLIVYNKPQENCIRRQPKKCWKGLPKSKSLFCCHTGWGQPIGNLTSQIFANFYLNDFDHYVKDVLGLRWYGRYVDDFFFIVRDKGEISGMLGIMGVKLREVGARLHPKKLYIQEARKGVKFVGAVIKPHRIYISNRTKGNFWMCLKRYADGLRGEPTREDVENFVASVNSYLGFMIHYNTYNIRKKALESESFGKWREWCEVGEGYGKIGIRRAFSSGYKL